MAGLSGLGPGPPALDDHRPLRRESLVSALTKKVLDHHTFTRTAPNTFDLLHRPV